MASHRSDFSKNPGGDYAVTLPVKEDQLKEFLAGLLGKPQTIDRHIAGPFKVTRLDIENIYVLLDQRISAQNIGALASFVARIVYNDNSSVQLSSFVQFQTYNEVKPLKSESIHLTWIYLVQFQNKSTYEKQQIDLTISVQELERQILVDAELSNRKLVHLGNRGAIFLRISHSDRSWGGDIDSLLTGHLEHLRVEEQPMRKWLSDRSGTFGFSTWVVLFGMALYAVYYVVSQANAGYIADLKAIETATPSIESLSRSLSLLSKFLVGGTGPGLILSAIVFVLVALIGSIAGALFVSEKASYSPCSFLLLTRQDDNEYQRAVSDSGSQLAGLCGSTLLSLTLGIVSNLLFYYLTKWLLLY
jgi:hypothetical protein